MNHIKKYYKLIPKKRIQFAEFLKKHKIKKRKVIIPIKQDTEINTCKIITPKKMI